jgi:citrate lyase synthetase
VAREKKTVDIRPMIEKAEVKGDMLHLFLADTEGAKARLHEILGEMLQQTTEEVQALIIKRISLYGYNSNVNQDSLVRK